MALVFILKGFEEQKIFAPLFSFSRYFNDVGQFNSYICFSRNHANYQIKRNVENEKNKPADRFIALPLCMQPIQ